VRQKERYAEKKSKGSQPKQQKGTVGKPFLFSKEGGASLTPGKKKHTPNLMRMGKRDLIYPDG